MAEFIYGSDLNSVLERMIANAENYLLLVSPYIKLHERIKDELKKRRADDGLQITLMFGKNEDNASKSISLEDINFLKEFPDVLICYERNLHAKIYANDETALITSMNLYQYSQNTNIECGVEVGSKETIYKQSVDYFESVVKSSTIIFDRLPQYKSKGFLGIGKEYTHSENQVDNIASFYEGKAVTTQISKIQRFNKNKQQEQPDTGYCIRTGVKIPYNPQKPFSAEAYQSWAKFKNPDYPERFCHLTGKYSNGKTSMRHPII